MGEVGTGGVRTRFIKSDWPFTEGLVAGTTKLSDEPNLIVEEQNLIPDRELEGL